MQVCRQCYDFNMGKHTVRVRVRPPPMEVHRGWLTKQGGVIKSWKKRLFVLDSNGVLSYFKGDPDEAGEVAVPSGTINTAACIKLRVDADTPTLSWPAACKSPDCGLLLQSESRMYRMYVFTSPPLIVQWGKKSTLCAWSPLCRDMHRR